MKIYSMTATFGKLEHETLTLKPGLNVLCAPNEWGKSTWCAFLLAMLYGLDTRAKTTKSALAEKERFAPWSGNPMEGRIDLNWQGRDITIERSTKGRIPLGVFRAYETQSGLDVPELTAANCGQQLLGVEQSVFRRAGFIRLADLPVTQDEALRSRLNALVTTGDESGDALRLGQNLRDLKNRCRYNRTGLIPQAAQQQAQLERRLQEREDLDAQVRNLRERQKENDEWLHKLENHRKALAYREAQADERRVAEVRETRDREVARMETMEAACAGLTARETVEDKCRLLRSLTQQWADTQQQLRQLPPEPSVPEAIPAFRGQTPEKAMEQAERDAEAFENRLQKGWIVLMMLGMFCLITAGALACLKLYLPAVLDFFVGTGVFVLALLSRMRTVALEKEMAEKYGTLDSIRWNTMARSYGIKLSAFEKEKTRWTAARTELDGRLDSLQKQREALCGDQSPEEALESWQQILEQWDGFYEARRDAMATEKHLETLMAMAKHGSPPDFADTLTISREDTEKQIEQARELQQRLQSRREQYRSRMDGLGDCDGLRNQLEQAKTRLQKLEDTYAAVTIALDTLGEATSELQRRFAPPISARAQELLSGMTGGRYDRLVLSEDFSLRAGAIQEDTLHDALWRSDGTVDQLYLALRLAVSEELTPEAPLILDDALVRFDDQRMELAMKILKALSAEKQIIVFTCQQRELLISEQP